MPGPTKERRLRQSHTSFLNPLFISYGVGPKYVAYILADIRDTQLKLGFASGALALTLRVWPSQKLMVDLGFRV